MRNRYERPGRPLSPDLSPLLMTGRRLPPVPVGLKSKGGAAALLALAGVHGAMAVVAGAYLAHMAPAITVGNTLPDGVLLIRVAADMQAWHAPALVAESVGLLLPFSTRGRWVALFLASAGWLHGLGTLVFSGALYAVAFGAPAWLAGAAPFGAVAVMLGWLALILAGFRLRSLLRSRWAD